MRFSNSFSRVSAGINRNGRKAIAPILAGALYVGILTMVIALVVQIGAPAIEKMQDTAAIGQAKDSFTSLDNIIREVSSEGKGSARVATVQVKKGGITVDPANERVVYTLRTKADVISPRTKRTIGNLVFSSNANVAVSENETDIVVENEYLVIDFNKTGNSSVYASIDASKVVKSVKLKEGGAYLDGAIHVLIDGNYSNEVGNGYVYAEKTGTSLARGRVIAHINNSAADYDIYYTIESGRDHFNEISVQNYNSHI